MSDCFKRPTGYRDVPCYVVRVTGVSDSKLWLVRMAYFTKWLNPLLHAGLSVEVLHITSYTTPDKYFIKVPYCPF